MNESITIKYIVPYIANQSLKCNVKINSYIWTFSRLMSLQVF
jgi:hypothetical protein